MLFNRAGPTLAYSPPTESLSPIRAHGLGMSRGLWGALTRKGASLAFCRCIPVKAKCNNKNSFSTLGKVEL